MNICKIVSPITKREITLKLKGIDLLLNSPMEIVEMMDDNICNCNTESGYSYCGCGEEFENCQLFVNGEEVKSFW